MISSLMGLPIAGRLAEAQALPPYRVSLIGGAFAGVAWLAGVRVDIDEGWKTYWRVPGDAGVPPQFDWTRSVNVGAIDVLYPLPHRFHDLSGESLGYKHQVVFPVMVKPAADATQVTLKLDLFLAVCKDVCIPATAQGTFVFGSANTQDSSVVEEWMKRVPVPGTPVESVLAAMDASTAIIMVKLTQPADDIFVESATSAYFRQPAFSTDGLEARLMVDNVKDAMELKGLVLRLTVAVDGHGIEQTVTVA